MRKIISLAIALLFATTAMAADGFQYELLSGNAEQKVKAGEEIQKIQFRVKYAQSVDPLLLNGLNLQCSQTYSFADWSTCEISGRVASFVPSGVYDMEVDFIDAYGSTKTQVFKTTVTGMASDLELLSGNANQTINAGESIEPIVYRYKYLKRVYLENAPSTLNVEIDPESYTFKIYGTTNESASDRTYEYKISAILQEEENGPERTVYAYGTLKLKKTSGKKSLEIVENETQNVNRGKAIKPIVIKYSDIKSIGIPKAPLYIHLDADDEKKLATITGTIPSDYLDASLKIEVVAEKMDGTTESIVATINVIENANKTTVAVVENAEQTVAPGDSIKPIIFQFQNLKDAHVYGVINGFRLLKKSGNILELSGKIPENMEDGVINAMLIVEGETNNDTAYAKINIVHKFAVTTVRLVSAADSQAVMAGDSIEPFVFEYENALRISAGGTPKYSSFSVESDTANHKTVLSGYVSDSAAAGVYTMWFIAEGLDNSDTVYVKLLVKNIPTLTLISGNLEQSVYLGDSIEPLVFKYKNIQKARMGGTPNGVTMVSDAKTKTLTVFGKVNESSLVGDYEFTVEVEGYGYKDFADGKIVVKRMPESSSSFEIASCSSVASSSSIASSSSEVSSSSAVSSSSEKSSSSSAESSSSAPETSSSSDVPQSSSSEHTTFAAAPVASPVLLTVENRTLYVSGSEMVRLDVFDMQGRPVANFKQVKGSVSLDMLRQGNYIVRVNAGSNSLTRRISIK
jgi:hypothetical protein